MCTCSTDFDSPSFCNEQEIVARKPYTCGECSRPIIPGEAYERTVGKWEGHLETHRTCLDCAAWRHALCEAQEYVCGCNGFLYGEVWQEIADYCEEHLRYDPRKPDGYDIANKGGSNMPTPYVSPDEYRRRRSAFTVNV